MLGVGDFALPLILVFHYFSQLLRHRVMTVYYANKLMDVGFRKKKTEAPERVAHCTLRLW